MQLCAKSCLEALVILIFVAIAFNKCDVHDKHFADDLAKFEFEPSRKP